MSSFSRAHGLGTQNAPRGLRRRRAGLPGPSEHLRLDPWMVVMLGLNLIMFAAIVALL